MPFAPHPGRLHFGQLNSHLHECGCHSALRIGRIPDPGHVPGPGLGWILIVRAQQLHSENRCCPPDRYNRQMPEEKTSPLSFEASLQELERIVKELEKGDLPLEQ